jgi:hypothetical protein
MVDDVNQRVEDAFKTLGSITERSGNLTKGFKNDILESVSTLRKVSSQLIIQLENVNEEHKKLKEEVKNATNDSGGRSDSQSVRQVAPSLDHFQQYPKTGARQVLPSEGGRRNFYSEMVKNEEYKAYKTNIESKGRYTYTETDQTPNENERQSDGHQSWY